MDKDRKNFDALLEKIENMKMKGEIDLSTEEDLSIAVMNLLSLEEHFFFTGEKTGRGDYFDLLKEVREARKELMGRLIPSHEGETWCISKHLLATTMRLIEVGTKLYKENEKEEAKKTFDYAYKMYSLFWGLRLNLIKTADIKETAARDKPWTLGDIVNKLVDCCDE